MLKNKVMCLALVALCAACSERAMLDQCKREELFKQCMAALPAGPVTTRYNDWNEVVDACGEQARSQSVRKTSQVKPECRGGI